MINGYSKKSKGYKFYCPKHSMRIIEIGNTNFIKNGEIDGSGEPRKVSLKEDRVNIPLPSYLK